MTKRRLLVCAAMVVAFLVIGAQWYLFGRPLPQADNPIATQIADRSSTQNATSLVSTAAKPATTVAATVGTPTAMPSLITVNTPTVVTVTVQINPTPIAGAVNLLRFGATGTQPMILGVMHGDGTSDGVYTLQVTFDESSVGQVQLEVSAAFQGQIKRTASLPLQIPVWGTLKEPASGFSILYPPALSNTTTISAPEEIFTLASSPQGVDIGGGGPEDGSIPVSSGFQISIEVDALPNFDVNQWLSVEYPDTDIATLTPLTIGGQPGYEIEFAAEVGAGQPLAVVYYSGYVYSISYASTFASDTPEDLSGLSAFNSVLQTFVFTR